MSFDGVGHIADKLRGATNVAKTVMLSIEKLNQECIRHEKKIPRFATVTINQLNLDQIPDIIKYFAGMNWNISVDVYRWSSATNREVDFLKITDFKKFAQIIEIAKESSAVRTPGWLLDGFIDYLLGKKPKLCPYIHPRSIGRKYFLYPNGDVKICIGDSIGNLLSQNFNEIFLSEKWQQRQKEILACKGCWNTCYTPLAKISNYYRFKEIKNVFKMQ